MNIRSVLIALALMALAVFALLNWAAFTTPTTLSVGLAEVQAPLGLIMLIVTVLLVRCSCCTSSSCWPAR